MLASIARRVTLGALLGGLLLPSALQFHAHLTRSYPMKDSTVTVAPPEIQLWFSERPERAVSRIILVAPDSVRTPLALAPATDDTLLIAGTVPGGLKPGQYTVIWRTASHDGHPVRGRFQFSFAPGTTAGATR